MPIANDLTVVWLTGASCDGCTIKALGDTTGGGLEALLAGAAAGLPRIRLVHPALSFESGDEFIALLRSAESGELGPMGLIVESSMPDEGAVHSSLHPALGSDADGPISLTRWMERLALHAVFVIAWGDCAVWGGPHSISINPMQATGVVSRLGWSYRSLCGLPVVHLPGCAPPPVLIATLITILRSLQGEGPSLELDDLYRPREFYGGVWRGAFPAWSA